MGVHENMIRVIKTLYGNLDGATIELSKLHPTAWFTKLTHNGLNFVSGDATYILLVLPSVPIYQIKNLMVTLWATPILPRLHSGGILPTLPLSNEHIMYILMNCVF